MKESILDLVTRVAEQAGPDEQIEAIAVEGSNTSVRAYGGEVESFTVAGNTGIGIRVIRDQRTGFAWAGSLDPDVIAATLADARDNSAFTEPDEWAGLAEPDGVEPADLDLWRDGAASMSADEKVKMALELEQATTTRDPRVASVRTAMYMDAIGEGAVATSTGIRVSNRSSIAYFMVSALGRDGDDTTTGGGLSVGRQPQDLSIDEAADDAIERAVQMLGASKPASQKVTLVLEPRLTATFLSVVGGMLNGESVLKGRSPFTDRVGEPIASPLLTFVDDPTDARSLGADAVDGEGLATRRIELVSEGVLQGFLHNSYTARRAGTTSTGSAVRGYKSIPAVGAQALAVAPGEGDLESLLASVENGLLVNSMLGLHSGVNPISGDFSVGVEGLMIRNGQRAEPIKEATIASAIQRMLLEIAAVGADLEWTPGGTGGVTLVIPDVSLSGS